MYSYRRPRKSLSCCIVLCAACAGLGMPAAVRAANYQVTSTADTGAPGTLRWAINEVDFGSGNTISFASSLSNQTITLSEGLPEITTDTTIDGSAAANVTISGANEYRVFFVDDASSSPNVTIENLNIANGLAQGGAGGSGYSGGGGGLGAGGGVFAAAGNVSLVNVAFTGNAARGGNGGDATAGGSNGGGGGMGGNGGNGGSTTGGGGGGLVGNGGAGGSGKVAGGGGGTYADGGSAANGGSGGGLNGGNGGYGGVNTGPSGSAGGLGAGGGGGGLESFDGGSVGGVGGKGGTYGGGGGGGGSNIYAIIGADGGFGGGGGGQDGSGGFGGGGGGFDNSGGNGGSAYGGAIFVQSTATLALTNTSLDVGVLTAGAGGTGTFFSFPGDAAGSSLYLSSDTTFNVSGGKISTIAGSIAQYDISAITVLGGAGGGTLVLGGSNSYSGGTTIGGGATLSISADANLGNTAGSVLIGPNSTLAVSASMSSARSVYLDPSSQISVGSGAVATFTGPLTGINNLASLTVLGSGTLILDGTNTYQGGTTLGTNATVAIMADDNLGDAAGGVTLGENSTLQIRNTLSSARNILLSAIDSNILVNSGMTATLSGVISWVNSFSALSAGGGGTLVLAGQNTYLGGTTIENMTTLSVSSNANLGGASGSVIIDSGATLAATASFSSTRAISISSNTQLSATPGVTATYSGVISAGASSSLFISGAGTVALAGQNTFRGPVTINTGATLSISSDGNLGDPSNSLTFSKNSSLATTANLSTGRTINLSSGNQIDVAAQTTATISGVIHGSDHADTLNAAGGGVLVLSGNNSYAGGTLISNGGEVSISSDANLGNVSGGLTIQNGSTLLTTATFSSSRAITLGSGGGYFDIAPGTTTTLAGTISGAGSLNAIDSGTLTLSATNNSYSGGTTVENSTLSVVSDGSLGASTGSVTLYSGSLLFTGASITTSRTFNLGGSTLSPAAGGSITYAGAVINSGQLGVGEQILGDGTSVNGTTFINGCQLSQAASSTVAVQAVEFQSGASFTQNAGAVLNATGNFDSDTGSAITVNGTLNTAGATIDGNMTINSTSTLTSQGIPNNPINLGGSLVNHGSVNGVLIIQAGGLAEGDGFFGHITLNAGGTFSPGTGQNISPSASTTTAYITPAPGNQSIHNNITLNADTVVTVNSPDTFILSGTISGSGYSLIKSGSGAADFAGLNIGPLEIAAGRGVLSAFSSVLTAKVTGLAIAAGATLDITHNAVIFNYAGNASPLGNVQSYIAAAYDHGNWDSPGLTSSSIAAQSGAAIGYGDNIVLNKTTFNGLSISSTVVFIQYTWLGDANLDGIVNASDLSMMSSAGTTWTSGDFNYDGVVNADDYALFALGALDSGGVNISTTLPEPAGVMLIPAFWATLIYRRKRPRI